MIVEVAALDHQGRGIVRGEKPIFVVNALPGEVVEIDIVQSKSKYCLAKVKKYLKMSSQRIKPICPYFDKCGGCQLMHLSYKEQLDFKQNKVEEIMKRHNLVTKIMKIVSSDELHYRNKVTFHVQNKKIGFYQEQSNEVIPIDYCYLLKDEINKQLKLIKDSENIEDGTILIKSGLVDNLVVQNGQILGNKKQIVDEINNFKFLISPESFFQVNTKQACKLYDLVKKYLDLKPTDEILDLYCGTGTIGMTLTPFCKKVYGVEINRQAILDALDNKKLNQVSNIEFTCLPASRIASLSLMVNKVIVDPPRAGLDKQTINYLIKNDFDTIVYVSCDPMTLARDLKLLEEKYRVNEITPVDMFPQTYHVEVVSLLELKKNQ